MWVLRARGGERQTDVRDPERQTGSKPLGVSADSAPTTQRYDQERPLLVKTQQCKMKSVSCKVKL